MRFNQALYFITDSSDLEEDKFLSIVEEALIGGVDLIQLREKTKSDREFLDIAFKIKNLTDKYNTPLIIDDRIDIALIVDASGVHLGQDDINIKYARKILGKDKIIGSTTKTLSQAIQAENDGADYLGVGAIFNTTTKVKTIITKISTLDEICDNTNIPVFAIGGINDINYTILENSNINGICTVSAIMKSENPREYTKKFKEKISNMIKNKSTV